MRLSHQTALSLILLGLASRPATAAAPVWTSDGVALCTATSTQQTPDITSDGAGGAIVVWRDYRNGNEDIYAQRISADGALQWTLNGVALCTVAGSQVAPGIVTDGAGGAIVVWSDYRSGDADIYAQRISPSGVPQWTADGLALCTAADDQASPKILADDAGGAIVTWDDYRYGSNPDLLGFFGDIFAQRVDAGGVPLWSANGVPLCTASGTQYAAAIVTDGAGGAIVTWSDYRRLDPDIYAQRINVGGVVQWTANGVAVCIATSGAFSATSVSDGEGGAILTWIDSRSGLGSDVYAQRIDAVGVAQWTANGVAVCTAATDQLYPTSVSDGAGGVIVTWHDGRSGQRSEVYAQQIDAGGVAQWTADGVALCTAAGNQRHPRIVADGAGGAVVSWEQGNGPDIYAQRISADGAPLWDAVGVALCTLAGSQTTPMLVPDGMGGAIVTWADYRTFMGPDIYAQRVSGLDPTTILVTMSTVEAVPGCVRLHWHGPGAGALAARIYRREAETGWELLGAAVPDGPDALRYEDRAVTAGARYAYRLGYVEDGSERFTDETWVDIPHAARFALQGLSPNPSAGDPSVAFSLPSGAPASLAVYDLHGRLVFAREVGALGAGAHRVPIDGHGRLSAGIYALRLRQGELTATARAVVIR